MKSFVTTHECLAAFVFSVVASLTVPCLKGLIGSGFAAYYSGQAYEDEDGVASTQSWNAFHLDKQPRLFFLGTSTIIGLSVAASSTTSAWPNLASWVSLQENFILFHPS
jgi:hypothetical protein